MYKNSVKIAMIIMVIIMNILSVLIILNVGCLGWIEAILVTISVLIIQVTTLKDLKRVLLKK